jgi:hypothetical protein
VPHSESGSKEDLHGAEETKFNQRQELLERSIPLAKEFKTPKGRVYLRNKRKFLRKVANS